MLRTLQTSNSETLWSTQNFILYFVCVDCTKSVASPHLTSARNSSLLSIGFISWSFLLLLRCLKYSTFCHKCEGTEAGSQSCESVLVNFIRCCWVQNREEKSRAFSLLHLCDLLLKHWVPVFPSSRSEKCRMQKPVQCIRKVKRRIMLFLQLYFINLTFCCTNDYS